MKLRSLSVLFLLVASVPAFAGKDAGPKDIIVTPPAPVFSEAERVAELTARRNAVFAEMADNSVMVLMSTEPRIYTNDVDFMYRQENNLYYLTNLKQQNATLVLAKRGAVRHAVLFIPKRNPQFETWNGHMYSNEEAKSISGVETIFDAAEFPAFLEALKASKSFTPKGGQTATLDFAKLYLLTPTNVFSADDKREFSREWDLANEVANVTSDERTGVISYGKKAAFSVESALPLFAKLRLVKSPYEVKIMQHAVDISIEAHMRAMATAGKLRHEWETQAEIEYVFRRRNSDYWGYPSIVGCGPNATTLHYVESQGEVKPGDLFLIDVGAEYDHYTADVTRTFPVNGKFSKEQAEIYQIVYDAQEEASKFMKPGAKMSEPGVAARKLIEERLFKLGLITEIGGFIPGTEREVSGPDGTKRKVGQPQSFLWFMHGLGHWLGMNVHDVGGGGNTVFKPGMIMTNEPGVYIRKDALDYFDVSKPEVKAFVDKIRPAFEKYKTIGVRIEDDVLITENGNRWLTANLPRTIDGIEFFIKNASKKFKFTASLEKPFINPDFDLLREDWWSTNPVAE